MGEWPEDGASDVDQWQRAAPGVLVRGGLGAGPGWGQDAASAPDPQAGARDGAPARRLADAAARRRIVRAGGVLTVLGALGVVGLLRFSGPDAQVSQQPREVAASPAPPGAPGTPGRADPVLEGPTAGPIDWWAVVSELDGRRASALAQRDLSALDSYAEPGSQTWRTDASVIDDLVQRGLRPVGLATRLVALEQFPGGGAGPAAGDAATGEPRSGEAEGGDDAEVVLVDQRSAYTLEDHAGRAVAAVPASGRQRWRVRLVRVDEPPGSPGWRISATEAVP